MIQFSSADSNLDGKNSQLSDMLNAFLRKANFAHINKGEDGQGYIPEYT